jgi:hypothetical protein
MWRCDKFPDDIRIALTKHTLVRGRRDAPHWSQEGPRQDSWDGWIWSNGDGWFWTQEEGWTELIPRFGRENPWQKGSSKGGSSSSDGK